MNMRTLSQELPIPVVSVVVPPLKRRTRWVLPALGYLLLAAGAGLYFSAKEHGRSCAADKAR